ncbi:MAG: hypothetical protein ACXVIJ_04610, partial [Thermoanaerobaculia bacterium]
MTQATARAMAMPFTAWTLAALVDISVQANGPRAKLRGRLLYVSSATRNLATARGAEAPSHEAGGVGCYVELGGAVSSAAIFSKCLSRFST